MNNKMLRSFVSRSFSAAFVLAAAVLPILAFAVERTWVGQSGGKWTDADNWSPSGTPAFTDTLVFNPSGDLGVTIGDGTTSCRGGGFRFESGQTVFAKTTGTGSSIAIYMGNVSNFFYVAEGASVVVSNRFMGNASLNNTARFVKTGKGRLTIESLSNSYWHYNAATDLGGVDFLEGETVLSAGENFPLYNFPISIQDGAMVRCGGSYRLHTTQPVHIAAGGVLDCGNVSQYAQSISGEGTITNHSYFSIYLGAGACTFSGRIFRASDSAGAIGFNARPSGMSDEDWRFVVGASNTLAEAYILQPSGEGDTIRFAPGVGDFWIWRIKGSSGQYLTLEDTNGDPVTVRAGSPDSANMPKFRGMGNFLTRESRSITSSEKIANMAGALGACDGATLTIGSNTAAGWPDISGLGGFIVEDGKIALKNKNASDAIVGGTVVFRNETSQLTATAALSFGTNAKARFEIPEAGLKTGVTPISAPTITFSEGTKLEAEAEAFRKALKKKTRLMLATASGTLTVPDAVLAAANRNAPETGCLFIKEGNTLSVEISRDVGFSIVVR